eukprot:Skav226579  [mRNA]  locus=scaffold2846:68715:74537:- [translate_table: standard]
MSYIWTVTGWHRHVGTVGGLADRHTPGDWEVPKPSRAGDFWSIAGWILVFWACDYYRDPELASFSWREGAEKERLISDLLVRQPAVLTLLQLWTTLLFLVTFVVKFEEKNFPLPGALMPVFGTVCFILCGYAPFAVLNRLLSFGPMVYIGCYFLWLACIALATLMILFVLFSCQAEEAAGSRNLFILTCILVCAAFGLTYNQYHVNSDLHSAQHVMVNPRVA